MYQNVSTSKESEEFKKQVLNLAMNEAIKACAVTAAVVGVATIAASYRYKSFNKNLSASAKMSFPVMAGVAAFSIKYEVTSNDAQYYPERWGLSKVGQPGQNVLAAIAAPKKTSSMPWHHKAINHAYDHPFQLVTILGIPFAAGILNQQLHTTHLTLSQKIMHSRVFAQAGILTILLFTMGFREYMDRHGRFPDPDAEPVVKEED